MTRPARPSTTAILAFGAVLAAGAAARAASYDVIHAGAESISLLDPAAIETVGDGRTRRVQIVRIQKSILSEGPKQPGYVATGSDYDCTQWRFRWRGVSAFSRAGERLVHRDNEDPAWIPIAGDDEATGAARIVCDGQASGSVYVADSLGHLVSALMQAWDTADPSPPPPALPAPPAPPPRKKTRP